MQVAKAFEIVQLDQTAAGDILQSNGCWAFRLECNYILYLNGKYQGVAEYAGPRHCLRLKDYDGIAVDFASISDATAVDSDSKNPLVIIDQGHALLATIGGEDKLFNFFGKEISVVPALRTGPWMATAVVSGTAKSMRLF